MANPVERLEYVDDNARTLAYRLPPQGNLQLAERATLVVGDQQQAVFSRSGKPLDTFASGVYHLDAQALPKLAAESQEGLPTASVHFLGMQIFRHQKWGTKHPIVIPDDQFGEVRLRSLGSYAFQIANTSKFSEIIEAKTTVTTEAVKADLHDLIVEALSSQLRAKTSRLLDLPTQFDAIAGATHDELRSGFEQRGLRLLEFSINSISLPKEVQEAVDKEHGYGDFADLRTFTLAQAASQQASPLDAATTRKPEGAKKLVRTVVDSASWALREDEVDVWRVTVPIGSLRKQTVTIDFTATDAEGHSLISFISPCGPANEEDAASLLRDNVQMVHGAFAIQPTASGEMLVVIGNQLADTADELEVTRILTAVAWQADQAEERLWGGDQY